MMCEGCLSTQLPSLSATENVPVQAQRSVIHVYDNAVRSSSRSRNRYFLHIWLRLLAAGAPWLEAHDLNEYIAKVQGHAGSDAEVGFAELSRELLLLLKQKATSTSALKFSTVPQLSYCSTLESVVVMPARPQPMLLLHDTSCARTTRL